MTKSILCLFFLFFLSNQAQGQQPVFAHYTIRDGLSSNRIYQIQQAPDGYIWIATLNGVCRFDGTQFKCFTSADGLQTNNVFSIFPDPAGRLWLSDFSKGIHYIKNTNNDSFTVCSLAATRKYFPAAVSSDGEKVFFTDSAGLEYGRWYVAGDQVKTNTFYDSLSRLSLSPGNEVIYCDLERAIFSEKPNHLVLVERGRQTSFFLPKKTLEALLYLRPANHPLMLQNKILLRTGPATYSYIDCNLRQMSSLEIKAMGATRVVTHKIIDKHLNITTDKGLVIYDEHLTVKDSFPKPSMLSSNSTGEMIRDRSGNIWITTGNDGLYLIPAFYREIRRWTEEAGSESIIRCIRIGNREYRLDTKGNLQLWVRKQYTRTIYLPDVIYPGRLPANATLLQDKRGGLYIASIKGIFHLDPQGKFTDMFYALKHPYTGWTGSVKDAAYDAADDRYYFSMYDRLSSYSPLYGIDSCTLAGRYNFIALPGENELWLANDNGITSWKRKIINGKVRLSPDRKISTLQISDMMTDPAGNVIVQVNGKGVLIFRKNAPSPYTISEKTIQLTKVTDDGLWLVSSKGIKLLTLHDKVYKIVKYIPNLKGILYDEAYDLLSDSTEVTLISKNGILRFPSSTGYYEDPFFKKKPVVAVYSSGIGYRTDTIIKQRWERADLNFRLGANSASYLGDISYEYFLEGIDLSWHTTSLPGVSYPVLPPGHYLFHVRTKVNDLDMTSAESVMQLTIEPRWWQSLWLKLLLTALLLGSLYCFFEWRLRRSRREMQFQAHLKSRAAQMELQALQSQMNPHFIFNALSAVKSYFKLNKIQEAEQLLEDFSRLIRLYLEFSKSPSISLHQELDALQLYTDIERRRFGCKFRVEFRIRMQRYAAKEWQIPPMILQPIVENAINHGLYRKTGLDGLLRIFILEQKKCLTVIIDDNGIGRERAAEINRKMPRLYPSRGSDLVRDRIQVLRASGRIGITHEITDKHDKENKACGTRVIVRFNKC